jgi:hypothetical protein
LGSGFIAGPQVAGGPESGDCRPPEFDLVAADLVEVAPPVGSPEDSRRTVELGARYLAASLDALLASGRKRATT